jgi:hypothetical protein
MFIIYEHKFRMISLCCAFETLFGEFIHEVLYSRTPLIFSWNLVFPIHIEFEEGIKYVLVFYIYVFI